MQAIAASGNPIQLEGNSSSSTRVVSDTPKDTSIKQPAINQPQTPASISGELQRWKKYVIAESKRDLAMNYVLKCYNSIEWYPLQKESDVAEALVECSKSTKMDGRKLVMQRIDLYCNTPPGVPYSVFRTNSSSQFDTFSVNGQVWNIEEYKERNGIIADNWLTAKSLANFSNYAGNILQFHIEHPDTEVFENIEKIARAVPSHVSLHVDFSSCAYPIDFQSFSAMLAALKNRKAPYTLAVHPGLFDDAKSRNSMLNFLRDPGPLACVTLPVGSGAADQPGFTLEEIGDAFSQFGDIPLLELKFRQRPDHAEAQRFIDHVKRRNRNELRQIVVHSDFCLQDRDPDNSASSEKENKALARAGIHIGSLTTFFNGVAEAEMKAASMENIVRQALVHSLSRPERCLAEREKEAYDADGDAIVAVPDDSSDEEWLKANADD